MPTILIFLRRIRDSIRARRLDRDLQQQIASHLDEAAEEYVGQGLSPADARRAALRRFGDVARVHEAWRDARSFLALESLKRDVRHATRSLRRNPGFSFVVMGVLAIGTGALTFVFALLNGVVLRPLPFADPDRLVVVRHSAPGLGLDDAGISSALYWQYTNRVQSLELLAIHKEPVALNLRLPDGGTERILVTYASARLFRVLRTRPALGRLFTEEDGRPGFMNMRWRIPVLLSHGFWNSHFGGDPGVIGRTLTINGSPREIVGVLPADFAFPGADTQMWMLIEPSKTATSTVRNLSWSAVGRMRPGATAASVQAELAHVLEEVGTTDPDAANARLDAVVMPLKSAATRDVAHLIWLLFGGIVCLLLVTSANAGVLFLVRAEHRTHEIAVRISLGAYVPHLARLFVIEALLLTSVAAAAGLLAVNASLSVLPSMIPFELPRASEIQLDAASILLAFTLAVMLAAFYGVLSARQTCERRVTWPHSKGASWGSDTLLVLQVALALTLMIGAALMARTYRNLSQVELGFSSDDVLTVEIGLPGRKAGQHVRIYHDVVDRLRRLPRVDDASAASFVPLTASSDLFPVEAGGTPIPFKFFVPGYFEAMGIALAEGTESGVLVSAALARRLYSGENAVGKAIRRLNEDGTVVEMFSGPVPRPVPPFTIAGVVADVQETGLRDGPTEIVYLPVIDPPVERSIVPTTMRLVVRSRAPLAPLAAAVRRAVASADPDLSVGRIETMDAIVRAARARETFIGTLLALAASVSLLLGAVGIYGSVAQLVRRRRREIAIRLALGATRMEVIRLATAGSMRAVFVGSALGLLLSHLAAQSLATLVFGVTTHDPLVIVAVAPTLTISAGAAALLAARRGASIAPAVALRSDP